MLRTVLNGLFGLGWAALIFIAVRSLVMLWRRDRQVAGAAAVAVAFAFLIGIGSPYVITRVVPHDAPPPPAASAPVAAAPAADGGCTPGMRADAAPARGAIDSLTVGADAPVVPHGGVADLRGGGSVHFSGWVAVERTATQTVCVLVDGAAVTTHGSYGFDRPDVAAALHDGALARSGFLVIADVPAGEHRVTVGRVTSAGTVSAIAPALGVTVR